MEWIRPLWSRIAGLAEQMRQLQTAQLVNALGVLGGFLLVLGLSADPIVGAMGGTMISNIAWLAVALVGLAVFAWLIAQLIKRGLSDL